MKLVKTAALASLFVFGSVFADGSAAPAAAATTAMSAAECATKLAQCAGADAEACKAELVKQGCKMEASSN